MSYEVKILALESSMFVGQALSYVGKIAMARETYEVAALMAEEAANMVGAALPTISSASGIGAGIIEEMDDTAEQMLPDLERLEPDANGVAELVMLAMNMTENMAGKGVRVGRAIDSSYGDIGMQITTLLAPIAALDDVANGSLATLKIGEGLTDAWIRDL